LLLVVGHPSVGHNLTDTDRLALLTAASAALTAGVVLAATQLVPRHRAALLGLAAGITFGVTAALLKQATNLGTGAHPLLLLASWPLYALIVIGGASLILSQAAYQSGPLAASLPPLTMADPLVAIALGVAVFDEDLTHTVTAITIQTVAFAVMTVAAIRLARRSNTLTPDRPIRSANPTGSLGVQAEM
jgi:drug/metabolite transporter (DMT)-like permease